MKKCCEVVNLSRIIKLVGSEERRVRVPALRLIGNLCNGPIDVAEQVIRNGGIPALQKILRDKGLESHYKEVCWTISNIAAGPEQFINHLIDANIFSDLSHLIVHSPQFQIRKEAAWAVANVCIEATEYQTMKLAELEVIPVIISAGRLADLRVQEQVIEAIENLLKCGANIDLDNQVAEIFKESQGINFLYHLANHPIPTVGKKAEYLLDLYFSTRYVHDDSMMLEDYCDYVLAKTNFMSLSLILHGICLLYTSDAADE
eukprot:TRINITY_DN9078_c0_g1_i16.p1 TRINITY_DN9078_c0_g1~~TRINITY_DN9078_c0_g1_i16.p1  ORF type:complete len:260 (+),score=53.77 TRINITY_DN9078_c0_g1_i16:336-1115(+)